jgi:hypothetical protein
MAKLSILAGATSVSVNLFVQNSSSTTGAGLTAIAPAAGSLLTGTKCYYTFAGANAASTQIVLTVLATVGAAYSSGGIVTIDDTNLPGVVRLDLPNAVLAAAKGRSVLVMLSGGTNMAPCVLEIELTGWDNQDGVRGGMTALPNAAAAASGGLIINGSNAGTVTLAALTITGATTHTGNVSMAAGLTITQSTLNANGISVTGNGTGHGILATSGSGATGDGFRATAASTNGNGLTGVHTGTGFDLNCTTSPPLQANATQIAGVVPGSATIGTVTNLTNAPTAGDLTATMKTSVTTAVWDVARTSHVAAGTFGQDPQLIRDGTAQGGDATHITLDAGASAIDNFYTNDLVRIIGGTGVGQARFISAYTGATKSATVATWSTNPDATSVFIISGFGSIPGAAAPTAAQVATAVWQDLTASADFSTAGSIGLLLATDINATISSRSTYAGGAVASVTGNVGGDVTGKVLGGGASAFTAVGVQADVEQIAGAALATHAAGMIPADVRDIVGAAVSTSTAQIGVNAVQIGGVAPGSATIGTVTNLTNAPTAGDFTATMKTSLNASTPAAITGNVGGNVVGSVGSVVARVTANTDQLAGQAVALDANNLLKVDVEDVNGLATLAELLQATPPALPTLAQAVMLVYMTLRNQLTTTASQKSIFNNAGVVICKSALSDDGTTFTEAKMVSGP